VSVSSDLGSSKSVPADEPSSAGPGDTERPGARSDTSCAVVPSGSSVRCRLGDVVSVLPVPFLSRRGRNSRCFYGLPADRQLASG
jgi:hypothetical protein